MTRRRWPVLLLLALLAGCGSRIELFGALPEREANEVLSVLVRAGIPATKVPGKNSVAAIQVDQRSVARAMDLLNAAGLPRDRLANIGDLFRREGLISSPSEERVRYIYGITQELSRTLTGIDGVLSARVHVVLPNNDPGQASRPSSAAVLIRHTPGALVESIVPRIKELVVNSIEGMAYERVSVVLVRSHEELPAAAPETVQDGEWVTYLLAGALVVALLGNGALGLLLWRRRTPRSVDAPLLTVTT